MPPKLPAAVVTMMAGREHRMHHNLWHQVRNMWLSYPESTRAALRALGWEPPRPALTAPDAAGDRAPILDNDSGEDFLYMHRRMIATVDKALARAGQKDYPKVEGWRQVPRPGDADYPVPPVYANPDLGLDTAEVKSDRFFNERMLLWERAFTEPARLRRMSLGVLGTWLESSIHNTMHMRWSADPGEIRLDVDAEQQETIDAKWDAPAYDWLGDPYSSHVNPHFWKLHGWIDDRIEDWKKANGIAGEIQWKGTWLGQAPKESFGVGHGRHGGHDGHHGHGGHDGHHPANMDAALKLVLRSGVFFRFYMPLKCDFSELEKPLPRATP